MTQKIEISLKTIVFTVIFLVLLKILWMVKELLFALFLSFIFMSSLKPLVNFLEKRKIPRFLSILLLFVLIIFSTSILLTFIMPPLVQESFYFLKNLPLLIAKIFPSLSNYLSAESFAQFLPDLTQNFVKIARGVFSNFIFIVSVISFTFYFLLEEKFLKFFLAKFLEEKQSEKIIDVFNKEEQRMGSWVRGEIILMLVIGVMSYIGLSLLGIKYALPLAIIAGLLEVVPIIGPTISAVPAFFVAASMSWFMGFAVIALYFLIQQLENNLIVPFVMKKAVGLTPIITLIALTIGGKLGGVLGILLSVPLALFIETLLIEFSKIKKSKS